MENKEEMVMRNVISLSKTGHFNYGRMQETGEIYADRLTRWIFHACGMQVNRHDGGSYDRGTYWYAKSIWNTKQPLGGGRSMWNSAAGQQATVYVNGKEVTYHTSRIFYIPCGHYRCVSRKRGQSFDVIACSNEMKDSVVLSMILQTLHCCWPGVTCTRGVNLIQCLDLLFDLEYYGGTEFR